MGGETANMSANQQRWMGGIILLGGSALIMLGMPRSTLDVDYLGDDLVHDDFQRIVAGEDKLVFHKRGKARVGRRNVAYDLSPRPRWVTVENAVYVAQDEAYGFVVLNVHDYLPICEGAADFVSSSGSDCDFASLNT